MRVLIDILLLVNISNFFKYIDFFLIRWVIFYFTKKWDPVPTGIVYQVSKCDYSPARAQSSCSSQYLQQLVMPSRGLSKMVVKCSPNMNLRKCSDGNPIIGSRSRTLPRIIPGISPRSSDLIRYAITKQNAAIDRFILNLIFFRRI